MHQLIEREGLLFYFFVLLDLGGHVTMITFNSGGEWQRLSIQGACVSIGNINLY